MPAAQRCRQPKAGQLTRVHGRHQQATQELHYQQMMAVRVHLRQSHGLRQPKAGQVTLEPVLHQLQLRSTANAKIKSARKADFFLSVIIGTIPL